MNRIDEILSRLYQYMGFSKDLEFCEKYHIKPNTLSTWKKRNKIPYELLEEISQNENLSMDWLLTGKGEMLLSEKNSLPTITNHTPSNNTVPINFYQDVYASAGFGSYAQDYTPIVMEFDKNFLEKVLNIRRFDKLDIIRVMGDSMLPYIQDGEYILIERDENAKSGDTVIAYVDGELYVKRLRKVPFENTIILESQNNNYPPIELDTPEKLQSLHIIGVMRSKIKLY